ncbi:MAG: hypothetical protein AN486_00015 [Anabaena sp. AL93]|nr:MAG: hypothetical protein AN486_00015 [Anabaena sp. AL93]
MVFQKRSWLLILLLLALVGAIAFPIIHISKTENLYPMSMLQKGYETKTENLYPINFSGKGYGYVNQAAQLVIEPQFDKVGKFSEGFAPVIVKNKWGFVNLKGNTSITLQNNIADESNDSKRDDHNKSSTDLSENILPGFLDKKLTDKYRDEDDMLSSSFSEGLAAIKLNGKWGFINQNGKLVIPYQFDEIQKFSGGPMTTDNNINIQTFMICCWYSLTTSRSPKCRCFF